MKMLKKLDLYVYFIRKMSTYRTNFDKIKCMSFSIKYEKLLERYNEIWKTATLVTLSKTNFAVNVYTMKNIEKLNYDRIIEKSI